MRLVREVESTLDEEQDQPFDAMQHHPTRPPPDRLSAVPLDQPDGPVDDAAPELDGSTTPATDEAIDLAAVEALLFATHSPLTAGRLAELLGLESTKAIRGAVKQLNRAYADTGRAFRIEQVAGGYQMLTMPQFGDLLKRMHQKEVDAKLSKPALETLAIIAYRQPILRADVEAVRGVACGETIRSLMEKHLVKIAGRAEELGRPILYGTTKRFLEVFGLNTLKDLPQPDAAGGAPLALGTSAEAGSPPAANDVPEASPPPVVRPSS